MTNSEQMLKELKEKGFHTLQISRMLNIEYQRLQKAKSGMSELKESDYRKLLEFYDCKMHFISIYKEPCFGGIDCFEHVEKLK